MPARVGDERGRDHLGRRRAVAVLHRVRRARRGRGGGGGFRALGHRRTLRSEGRRSGRVDPPDPDDEGDLHCKTPGRRRKAGRSSGPVPPLRVDGSGGTCRAGPNPGANWPRDRGRAGPMDRGGDSNRSIIRSAGIAEGARPPLPMSRVAIISLILAAPAIGQESPEDRPTPIASTRTGSIATGRSRPRTWSGRRPGWPGRPRRARGSTLDGSSSSGGRVWYRWLQTQGPRVVIDDPTRPEARFTVPADASTLGFVLVVGNANGVDARSVRVDVDDPDRRGRRNGPQGRRRATTNRPGSAVASSSTGSGASPGTRSGFDGSRRAAPRSRSSPATGRRRRSSRRPPAPTSSPSWSRRPGGQSRSRRP